MKNGSIIKLINDSGVTIEILIAKDVDSKKVYNG